MLEILTTYERRNLKQNPKWTQNIIKKPNRLIETFQEKLTPNTKKHPKVLFHQSFSNLEPTTYMEALSGSDALH
jgi:hypothetical protein